MSEKNLSEELELLKKELRELKKSRFNFKRLFQSASFVNGFIFSLIMIPLAAYATFTVSNSFSGGTTISASQVNQNFQDIVTKLNQEKGFLAEMSSNQTVNCSSGGATYDAMNFDQIFRDDSNYDAVNYAYTVPVAGYYHLVFYSTVISGSKYNFKLYINGSAYNLSSSGKVNELLKLATNSILVMRMSCNNKKGDVSMTIDSSKSYFGLIPF